MGERKDRDEVLLGGVVVDDRQIHALARIVGKPLKHKLDTALLFRAKVVGLTREEKAAVLAALRNAPADLQSVRELLLTDESWQATERP